MAQHQFLAVVCACPTLEAFSVSAAAQDISTRVRMLSLWTRLTSSIKQPVQVWTNVRLFSHTSNVLNAPKDGKDTTDDALKAARRARHRDYYHRVVKRKLKEDPAFFSKWWTKRRESQERIKEKMQEDADFRTKILQKRKEYQVERCRKLNSTVQTRRASREYYRSRVKKPQSAQAREHWRMAIRDRRLQDDAYYQQSRFISWLKGKMKTQNFEFRTHQPRMYGEKVEKHCASCNRSRPLKLWWQRKTVNTEGTADTEQFDCMPCFFNNAGDNLMPIGFEGHTFERRLVSNSAKDE